MSEAVVVRVIETYKGTDIDLWRHPERGRLTGAHIKGVYHFAKIRALKRMITEALKGPSNV